MRDIAGDGRLTHVFATMAKALLKKPVSQILYGVANFVPLGVWMETMPDFQRSPGWFNNWHNTTLDSLLPAPGLFVSLGVVSLCFAALAGPSCVLTFRAIYPAKPSPSLFRSYRAVVPVFSVWAMIYLTMTLWGVTAELLSRHLDNDLQFVIYIWLGLLIAALAGLPAFLSLLVPVFTLESGTLKTKWQRMLVLGAGFRWRMIGYALVSGLLGLVAAFSLATAFVAVLPASLRIKHDDWIYMAHLGVFWMMMCVLATAVYCRLKIARGELDAEDVAAVFA
jgi:hypothetical protein